MKYFFFITIIFIVQTAFSQNQPITVLSHKWFEKIEMRILQSNDPFGAENSEITTGINLNRPPLEGVKTNKYFVYEMVVKNESGQNIIGLALDYVFLDSQGKVERTRKNFKFFQRKIKKNKKETLIGTTNSPPELVLNAKDYEDEKAKPKEMVEVNCVVFEDKTTWKRAGVEEKVCEELRLQIKKREERLKRYR